MSVSRKVICLVFVVNCLLCLSQYLAQEIDWQSERIAERHSLIPGTEQKFLYWQDFYTETYGDLIGIFLLQLGFVHLYKKSKITSDNWTWVRIITLVTVFLFVAMCLSETHKPDWGFPTIGNISLGGLVHLPYLGINVGMGLVCLWHFIVTKELRGLFLYTALLGGGIWIGMWITDFATGNFDPIKPIEQRQ